MEYGMKGYGIYFAVLERLRDDSTYSSSTNYNAISYDLHEDKDTVKSVIEDFDLFEFSEDGSRFWSKSFNDRMAMKDATSKKRAEAGKKGATKRWNGKNNSKNKSAILSVIALPYQKDSNVIARLSNVNSPAMARLRKKMANHSKESKGKRSKGKKREVKEKDNNKQSSLSSFQKLSNLYQENIGALNGITSQSIEYAIKDFEDKGNTYDQACNIVAEAINVAALKNVHNWKFIQGVLNNWQNDSLFTLENIKAHEKARKKEPEEKDDSGYTFAF